MKPLRKRRWVKILFWIFAPLITLGVAGWIWFSVSPWPGSMVIRAFFEIGGAKTNDALAPYVSDQSKHKVHSDIAYGDGDGELLDIYVPDRVDPNLPTVVWFHGGAWVSGAKEQTENFYKIMADDGYTVVGVNYSLAPEQHYPAPVHQGIAALEFVAEHGGMYGINSSSLILAGDSAGAQIASQLAVIATNTEYASRAGFELVIPTETIQGTILFCGALDGTIVIPEGSERGSGIIDVVLWAYAGTHDYLAVMQEASPAMHLTKDFPRTFISAGNADPLAPMSYAFQAKLEELELEHTALFFPEDYPAELPHEYQFEFTKFPEAVEAYQQMSDFIDSFRDE